MTSFGKSNPQNGPAISAPATINTACINPTHSILRFLPPLYFFFNSPIIRKFSNCKPYLCYAGRGNDLMIICCHTLYLTPFYSKNGLQSTPILRGLEFSFNLFLTGISAQSESFGVSEAKKLGWSFSYFCCSKIWQYQS